MPGKHEFDESDLRPDDEPIDPEDRVGQAHEIRGDDLEDDDLDGDPERRVARRPNPLPSREEDDEELAEADILEELDLEDTAPINGSGA